MVGLIESIARRPAPYTAHIVLGHARSLFNWAINRGTYGLETSPCDRVKPSTLIGAKQPRQRVLNDAELASLWNNSDTLGYPFGPLYKLLLLTGARKSEMAGARWKEIDLKKKLWTVPPERFKSNASHLVPLSDSCGCYHRSATAFHQRRPSIHDHLWREARLRFQQGQGAHRQADECSPPWVVHDIRRTVRTRLASLRVSDLVAEMVIGHGRRGIQRVYDQHTYEPEMREALELWAARLRDIVTPPPENVVRLRKGRRDGAKDRIDTGGLLHDLYVCFLDGRASTRKGLSDAFVERFRKGHHGEIRSWDEVFGKPHPLLAPAEISNWRWSRAACCGRDRQG